MLTYYFNKRIPDDEWRRSPGENGESIQFFPNFKEEHFYWKDQFDYYSDIFYYKLFSVWDTIGHMLNVIFEINVSLNNVHFKTVLKKLEFYNKILYEKLEKIKTDPVFEKASEIRNDITHNYLPNSVGLIVKKTKKNITVGVKNYFTTKEIKENIESVIILLKKTIEYIKDI